VWTVGRKVAVPAIRFSVNAPCLPGGEGFAQVAGIHMSLTCETADGRQTFVSPSDSDPFRTPDGRLVPGRTRQQTPEQYHTEILEHLLGTAKEVGTFRVALQSSRGGLGDETAELNGNLIAENALNDHEIRNVL